ncbi:hypothetical protein ACFLUP_00435 [Chloroflexota bacterium]
MPKYLITWEIESARTPIDPKERGKMWTQMLSLIQQDMKDGKTTDWGSLPGEGKGYSISEQSALDLSKNLQRFSPFIKFQVNQVMTLAETIELSKSLME